MNVRKIRDDWNDFSNYIIEKMKNEERELDKRSLFMAYDKIISKIAKTK